MSVEIQTDKAKWAKIINHASERGAYALAQQMYDDCERYVPSSGGAALGSEQSANNLRENGRPEPGDSGEWFLVWDTIYALYQWFGMRRDGSHQVHHYTTPGTGKMWVETAKEANAEKWRIVAQNAFNENME